MNEKISILDYGLGNTKSLANALEKIQTKYEWIRKPKQLKRIECDSKCGFMIRSHNEKEIIEIAKQHSKKVHKINVSDAEFKKIMKTT